MQQQSNSNRRLITDIAERIEKFRKSLDLSRKVFCNRIGVNYGTFMSVVGGRYSEPSAKLVKAIVDNLSADATWLLTGEGEMFSNQGAQQDVGRLIWELQNRIDELEWEINRLNSPASPTGWGMALEIVMSGLKPGRRKATHEVILAAAEREKPKGKD